MSLNMDHDAHEHDVAEAEGDEELSPAEQLERITADLHKVVTAELDYFYSRLSYSRFVLRWAFRYGAIAAFTFGAAGMALVIGLLLTLSPKVGPLVATLIVTGSFAAIGIIAGLRARKWFRSIYFPEIDGDPNGQQ